MELNLRPVTAYALAKDLKISPTLIKRTTANTVTLGYLAKLDEMYGTNNIMGATGCPDLFSLACELEPFISFCQSGVTPRQVEYKYGVSQQLGKAFIEDPEEALANMRLRFLDRIKGKK